MPVDQYIAMARQQSHHPWNVVLMTVESLRADQLRAYGGSREIMPALDQLASEARVFLNSYTQSSHTNYATIVPLSSHYPLRSATMYSYPKNPTYPRVLIYDLLKALGYRTAIFSSSNENWSGMINFLDTGNLDRFIHAANSKKPTYLMPATPDLPPGPETPIMPAALMTARPSMKPLNGLKALVTTPSLWR
jgi:phosphoglycerol transferase MdoB-like AlkP superfamily enzyme